jgi:hypothetical protein
MNSVGEKATADEKAAGAGQDSMERLQQLVARAQQGDHSVLPELRQALDGDASLWGRVGDLAVQAEAIWLNLVAGKDLFLRETVERKMKELRAELAGPGPSPLERLLVDRVVACWLQVNYADCIYPQSSAQESTPAIRQELMKRQESAQRRYLAALKALELVRKHVRPAISPVDLAARPVPECPPPSAPHTSRLKLAEVN